MSHGLGLMPDESNSAESSQISVRAGRLISTNFVGLVSESAGLVLGWCGILSEECRIVDTEYGVNVICHHCGHRLGIAKGSRRQLMSNDAKS